MIQIGFRRKLATQIVDAEAFAPRIPLAKISHGNVGSRSIERYRAAERRRERVFKGNDLSVVAITSNGDPGLGFYKGGKVDDVFNE